MKNEKKHIMKLYIKNFINHLIRCLTNYNGRMPPKGFAKTNNLTTPKMQATNYGMRPTTTWELR
jgi:hypothetical protein